MIGAREALERLRSANVQHLSFVDLAEVVEVNSTKGDARKRFAILAVLILTLAAVQPALAAPAAQAAPATAAAGGFIPAPQPAATCPLFRACPFVVGVGCLCTGYVCNGKFICGVPVTGLSAASSGSAAAPDFLR